MHCRGTAIKVLGVHNDTTVVTEQYSDKDYLHAAGVMFTLPICYNSAGTMGFGWSAGIGTSSESPLFIFGPSLILGENFLLNLGGVITQFEELAGTFAEGANVGAEPLDSSVLTEKRHGVSLALTLGFRFK